LVQEEAATVDQLIQKRLIIMAENKQAPHTYIDQVFPGTESKKIMTKWSCYMPT